MILRLFFLSGAANRRVSLRWTRYRPLGPPDQGVICLGVTDSGPVVIAGAGLAGFRTVEELRLLRLLSTGLK